MNIPGFFFASLILAAFAIGLHLAGMSLISRGVHIRAHAVTLPESDRADAKMEASSFSSRGVVLGCAGVAFALTSVGFAVASARRHEPARRSIVVGLLLCYVMLQLLLV